MKTRLTHVLTLQAWKLQCIRDIYILVSKVVVSFYHDQVGQMVTNVYYLSLEDKATYTSILRSVNNYGSYTHVYIYNKLQSRNYHPILRFHLEATCLSDTFRSSTGRDCLQRVESVAPSDVSRGVLSSRNPETI